MKNERGMMTKMIMMVVVKSMKIRKKSIPFFNFILVQPTQEGTSKARVSIPYVAVGGPWDFMHISLPPGSSGRT